MKKKTVIILVIIVVLLLYFLYPFIFKSKIQRVTKTTVEQAQAIENLLNDNNIVYVKITSFYNVQHKIKPKTES